MQARKLLSSLGKPTAIVFAVIAVSALVAGFYRYFRRPAGPRIALPTRLLDFGVGKPNEVVRAQFQIRSIGSKPLEFTLRNSCACSEVFPRAGRIEPGQFCNVTLAMRLASTDGSFKRTNLFVASNDPVAPSISCELIARVEESIIVRPNCVQFGRIRQGTRRTVALSVTNANHQPFDVGDIAAKFDSAFVQVDYRTDENHERKLVVSLSENAPLGRVAGTIELRRKGSEGVVYVPVDAIVASSVTVAPAIIHRSSRAGDAREATILVWRPDGEPLGELASCSPESLVRASVFESTDSTRRRVRLAWEPDGDLAGAVEVNLRFTGCPEPAVVKICP